MARIVISPSSYVNNKLCAFSFTTLASSQEGWYLAPGDVMSDVVLVAQSTHTSAVPITICAGTSEMTTSYMGQDFIYKWKGDLSTSISSSGIAMLVIDSVRFKSTSGLYIDCATSGSTALGWAAYYRKPKL